MRIKRKVMPGQPGTHKLVKQYGDALICVRYRYDTARKRRLKTVELIIEETPWEKDAQRIPPNKIVALKVDYHEKHLQKIIKSAGGKWHPPKQQWQLPYGEAKQLGLLDRIIEAGK